MTETIYHYTTSPTLTSIIGNRSIRLSAKWHLNDPREGSGFFELLNEYARSGGEALVRKFDDAIRILDQPRFYVGCFSENGDLLSQWRGYVADGTGFSIGLNHRKLCEAIKGQSKVVIRPVTYADSISDINENSDTFKLIKSIFSHGGTPNEALLQTIAKERWSLKRTAYSEEMEHRIIYTPSHSSPPTEEIGKAKVKRGFSSSTTELRDFYDIVFEAEDWADMVTHVYIGPKNRSNPEVVEAYLASNGLYGTEVKISSLHYR